MMSKEQRESIRRLTKGRVVPQSSDADLLECLDDLDEKDKENDDLRLWYGQALDLCNDKDKRIGELEAELAAMTRRFISTGSRR